ncbi:DUF4124 domain-containing protein [Luteimonas aestuarii]|uniref:DUF4124 domain-containing protein n=1 Tax=Luteimonas aestuarii TaxID=453837 RepID=A0A4V3AMJ7_9GAMM|nr:DUF4124 domain-containing protein [Luteimonas aestuarii]TDK27193.1 DUF4124 domain-containing protein [Luteimonas aestuarii]
MRTLPTLATALAGLLLAAGHAQARQAGEVTVYRCVDGKGHVTLGDVPCPAGSSGEARTMQRPQDAPERPRPVVQPAASAAPPAPAPQLVMLRPPQPMYECIAPDGSRYTSDTADGRPRWVPLWTLGYRGHGRPAPGPSGTATNALAQYHANRPLGGYVGAPTPTAPPPTAGPPRPGPRPPAYPVGTPGTWVQDTCHALPPAEVCARLRDRRDEIRRRFFNAQETERSTLRVEERGINARLDSDCR